jgi:hypothetical protein
VTHRNPPARIRWDDAFDAWGVTSTTDPNDTILCTNWCDAIYLANNARIEPTEATITPPDHIQAIHFNVRTHA